LQATLRLAIVSRPGEAESGSAGVQPDKEYPGRRCADGASGLLWAHASRGRLCHHRTPELCLRKPTVTAPPKPTPLLGTMLAHVPGLRRLIFFCLAIVNVAQAPMGDSPEEVHEDR